MKRKNKFFSALELIRSSFKISSANYITLILSSLVLSARSIFQMFLPALLIEVITDAESAAPIMTVIFIYSLVILLADASQKAFSLFSTAFGYTATNRAALRVGQKGMRIDYGCWEDTATYEKIVKAMNHSWVFQTIADALCENWISAIITLVPVLYILSYINIYLMIPLLLLIAAEIYLERKSDNKAYDIEMERMNDEKELRYNEKVMTDLKYGKELRLYNAVNSIISRYETSKRKVFSSKKRQKKVDIQFQISAAVITCVESMIVYIFAVRQYQQGIIAVSFFLLFINAVHLFTDSVKTIVETFTWVREITDYYDGYKEFMDEPERFLSETNLQKQVPVPFDIELKDVGFRYPNTKEYALRHVNLTIPYGSKIAVVGENGAGKSTLVKLIMRLYDVTEGEILLNGINIKNIDYMSYLHLFSTVFQDYKLHSYSIRENISFQEKGKDELIWDLLKRQKLYEAVKSSPKGLDTFLTKQLDEDGKDFSGGEKQRMAMVRALFKNADIFVLDEPTSAIDPIAELEYFKNLKEETKDKTAIYITHRMASTKFADKIIVFEGGEIVEQGKFAELIHCGGRFAELFSLQASYYKK